MAWKSLGSYTSVGPELPTLLISTSFGSASYTVHLTDLTHIWSESLERRDIYRRSQKESTSIDPTDGDQIHVLLDKIRLGIDGGKGTSLSLAINRDADTPEITLNITVDLPGGLNPLEWPIILTPASQSLLTAHLVVPLLEAQQMRMREMASLADILRDKDQVIQKLVDKLESEGTELGQVFPHIAGKSGRKIDRKSAEEKVKGLKLFDKQVWRQGLENGESPNIEQLASQIFGSGGPWNLNIKGSSNISKRPDNWWQSLKGDTFELCSKMPTLDERSKAKKGKGAEKSVPKEEESTEDDDDFQVQVTPPRRAQNEQKRGTDQPMDDESTEDDDDDLDAPSQKPKIPDSSPPSQLAKSPVKKAPKKLGVLGGKREPPKPIPEDDDETEGSTPSPIQKSHRLADRSASPVAEPSTAKPKRTLGRVGGKKTSPQPEVEEPAKEQPKPSRGRLGQIGGKKKEPTPSPSEPEPEAEAVASPPKPAVETKKKLGSLGGAKSKAGGEASVRPSEEPRGRAIKQEEEKEPPPRETSEERANKKREQLKIELEQRAKAPAKKKRKF